MRFRIAAASFTIVSLAAGCAARTNTAQDWVEARPSPRVRRPIVWPSPGHAKKVVRKGGFLASQSQAAPEDLAYLRWFIKFDAHRNEVIAQQNEQIAEQLRRMDQTKAPGGSRTSYDDKRKIVRQFAEQWGQLRAYLIRL